MMNNSLTIQNSKIILIFYIALTITSLYGINILGTTWQTHDSVYIKTFNCTCLTENEFQCLHEAVQTGTPIHKTKCNAIEDDKEPTKYEFCDCGSSAMDRCFSPKCYVINHPVAVPDRCDNEKCDAFDGLQMWMSAAKGGIIVGALTSIILSLSLYKAVKKSETNIDIPSFYLVNLIALVPPATVAFSLATTEVQRYYGNFELNAWSSVMTVGFGLPLCVGWICSAGMTCFKAVNFARK